MVTLSRAEAAGAHSFRTRMVSFGSSYGASLNVPVTEKEGLL
jgi:hypothetical protein